MKRYIFLPCLALLLHFAAHAQTTLAKPAEEYGFNKSTVVTNGKGLRYKYIDWTKLTVTGKYYLTPLNAESDSTTFILTQRDTSKGLVAVGIPKSTLAFRRGNHFLFLNATDVNGTLLTAEEIKGKIVVINFWSIASPPSRYEIPELNRLVDSYKKESDVIFLSFSINKKEDLMRFLNVAPFKYRVIGDAEPYFSFYGAKECPVNLVIDKKGTITFQSQGYNNGMVAYWINRSIKEIRAAEIKAAAK